MYLMSAFLFKELQVFLRKEHSVKIVKHLVYTHTNTAYNLIKLFQIHHSSLTYMTTLSPHDKQTVQ